jgi:phosphatidylinositol glycan class K
VIVSASKYWFNYRHSANALTIYHRLRSTGVPDSNIVLMLADDFACDARNTRRGHLYNSNTKATDLYEDVEVDYRGNDVTAANLLQVLSGRHSTAASASQQLLSDEQSDVLLFLTGHGGEEFLKFRDSEELTANDLATAISQMHAQRRYGRMLFLADTCEAATLGNHIAAPDVAFYSSSLRAENSYSHHADYDTGVLVIDRFTHHLDRLATTPPRSPWNLTNLFDAVGKSDLLSHVGHRSTMTVPMAQVRADDFLTGRFPASIGTNAGYKAMLATAPHDAGGSAAARDRQWEATHSGDPGGPLEQAATATSSFQATIQLATATSTFTCISTWRGNVCATLMAFAAMLLMLVLG